MSVLSPARADPNRGPRTQALRKAVVCHLVEMTHSLQCPDDIFVLARALYGTMGDHLTYEGFPHLLVINTYLFVCLFTY